MSSNTQVTFLYYSTEILYIASYGVLFTILLNGGKSAYRKLTHHRDLRFLADGVRILSPDSDQKAGQRTRRIRGTISSETGATMRDYEFTVVMERDEDGRFVAICPALQGCYTEGETEAEAHELIADAIRLHIESRLARNEPIHEEVGSHKVRVAV
jgi:predicted RNase H-like HicB family nuclease